MRRALLILASVASALLTVVLAGAWARSFFATDRVSWAATSRGGGRLEWRNHTLWIGRGQLRLDGSRQIDTGAAVRTARLPRRGVEWHSGAAGPAYMPIDGPPPKFHRFGVVLDSNRYELVNWDGRGKTRFSGWTVVLPLWLLTLLAGVVPAIVVSRILVRRRRIRRGACAVCGYDLRATPDCRPECGAVPEVPRRTRA
jgi:hypothetical protein